MLTLKKIFCRIAFCLFPFFIGVCDAQTVSKRFCETGVFVSPQQVKDARSRFVDPRWKADSDALQLRVSRLLAFKPAPSTSKSSSVFLQAGRRDSTAAIDLALYATIGDNPAVQQQAMQKAREILLAWGTATVSETQFAMAKPSDRKDLADYAGLGLYVGQIAIGAIHAFQLTSCARGLSEADDKTMQQWFRRMADVILVGRRRWEESGYFGGQLGNNHLSTHNAAIYAIGVAVDDSRLRQWAVRAPENKTNFMTMLDLALYSGTEQPAKADPNQGRPPHRGEIYDRYRMSEDSKGLSYAFVHLLQLAMLAEAAENQGEHLYVARGRNGETLRDSFRYYAEFLAQHTCSPASPPDVSKGPAGFEYYRGAKVEPVFWVWMLPLVNRFTNDQDARDVGVRVKSNACMPAAALYSPVPFSVFTN